MANKITQKTSRDTIVFAKQVRETRKTVEKKRDEVLPAGTPQWISMDLVRDTIETWQPFYSSALALQDAVNILLGMGRLFRVLAPGR